MGNFLKYWREQKGLSQVELADSSGIKRAVISHIERGEIIKLKWSDIDFERGFITLSPNKGGLQENIPLNSHVIAAINELKSISFESDYLFPAKDGGQRERFSFDKPLARFRKEAGLPVDFRPMHGSRHYFASTLASSGKVDMYTLQKLLTHKSPKMTQRYAHLRDEALKKAADITDDLFDKLEKPPDE